VYGSTQLLRFANQKKDKNDREVPIMSSKNFKSYILYVNPNITSEWKCPYNLNIFYNNKVYNKLKKDIIKYVSNIEIYMPTKKRIQLLN